MQLESIFLISYNYLILLINVNFSNNQVFMRTALILVILLSVVLVSCNNQDFDIIIENKRNQKTDSLLVYVQGKRFIVNELEATQRSSIKVKLSSIALNAHDFKIESVFMLKKGKLNKGFYYSDLSGTPNSNYTIEVYDSITVIK